MKTLNRLVPAAMAVLALCLGSGALADEIPLTLLRTTPLPAVTGGDFDHFAVDSAHDRLFVSAEVYASIEVFELKSGRHLLSKRGVAKSPHKLELIPDKNELLVADAADASCKILDADDLHLIKRNDPTANKLYVDLRDKKQIGVVDLKTKRVVATWTAPEMNLNSAMVFDGEHHRLFIGSRNPGKLYVLDSDTGRLVKVLDTVNISDDMTLDPRHRRLYISGADGVDVLSQDDADHYRSLQRVDTYGGKTSVYVPSLEQFYVVHTKGDQAREAGLQVFKVN